MHLNSFLGCVKLETGGKIVACLQMITSLAVLISLIYVICAGTFNGDQGEKPLANEKPVAIETVATDNRLFAEQKPTLSVAVLILIAIFITASCLAIVVIAFRSFNAIKSRNYNRMFEMMALMFAVTCFYMYVFLIQLWLWPIQCIATVFIILYNFYLFLVVYSLYRVFRKEYEQEAIRQKKALIEANA